jgi:hypothetical protein
MVYGRFAPCLLAPFGRRMADHTAGTCCWWMRQACLRLGRTDGAVAA